MFKVKSSREVRGLTYMPNGQQISGWLRKGQFVVIGECSLAYTDLGQDRHSPAVELLATNGERWYVALAVLQQPIS